MLTFKLNCPKCQEKVSVPQDCSLSDLVELINNKTGIPPHRVVIASGYPPATLHGKSDDLVVSLGLSSGSVLVVREGAPPSLAGADSAVPADAAKNPILETLKLMGFDESISSQAIDIAGDDIDLAVDVCRQLSGQDPAALSAASLPPPAPRAPPKKTIIRRVINADNSCLFNSIGYLMVRDKSRMGSSYRQLVAEEIRSKADIYTEDILGQTPEEYVSWILNPDKWGGEIEMNILSARLNVEIGAIDVQTGNLYLYGQEHGFPKRIYVLYDGIHYDAVVEALVDSEGNSREDEDCTVFDSSDSSVVDRIKALAADLRSKKQFVNLSGFELQCLVCMKGLKGQKEAQEHAKSTGHQNFGQVDA